MLNQHEHEAKCLTTQSKGILRAGRNPALAKCAYNIVDLVRCTECKTEIALREFITRKARHILFVNGAGHIGLFSIEECVFATHNSLQFCELCHHPRHEIGFRQFCRTARIRLHCLIRRRIRRKLFDNRRDKPPKALCLLVHGTESLLKYDRFQLFTMLCERFLSILIKEELRIRKTRTQDALIAVCHNLQILSPAIAHCDEHGQEAAVCCPHREVTLMVAHGCDNGSIRET